METPEIINTAVHNLNYSTRYQFGTPVFRDILSPVAAELNRLTTANAELEAHVQQLSSGIGERHDAADASRQRIEELEEQNEKLRSALRRWHETPAVTMIYRDAFLAELRSGEQGLTPGAESYREIADLL